MKKKGTGWLYGLLAVCLAVSSFAAVSMLDRVGRYQETKDEYQSLQQEAFIPVSTEGAQPSAAPSATQATEASPDPSAGTEAEPASFTPESENVVDEDLLWILSQNKLDDYGIDTLGNSPTGGVTTPPAVENSPGTAAPAPTLAAASTPLPSPTPTVAERQGTAGPAGNADTDTTATHRPGNTVAGATTATVATTATAAPAATTATTATTATVSPVTTAYPTTTASAAGAATGTAAGTTASSTATPAVTAPGASAPVISSTPKLSPSPLPTTTPTPSPTPIPTDTPVPAYLPGSGINMERAVEWTDVKYAVDFDFLSRINEQITGWLYQEGTEINYPIVRGTNNTFYLNHLFDGTSNQNGCVFMDCGNSIAFIDSGTYVYGHNTKDGSMFASVSNYTEQAYYDEHPQMVLLTPFADYQVDLFACMQTVVEDETSWRVKEFDSEKAFNTFISGLRRGSLFTAPAESIPQWGDRLLVLVTCTNIRHGQRFVVFGRMRPIVYQTSETVVASKLEMDTRDTQNGYATIPGVGKFMVYAQNDPLWSDLRFEARATGKRRKFGEGGCGPTAVAMALVNLVDKEDLPKLIGYSNSELGYTFCSCSVNQYYCNHRHAQYQLKTADEFLRYMPLAVASFTTGNNIWGIRSRGSGQGTNMRFLEKLCNLYNIGVFGTRVAAEAIDMLRENQGRCMVISCATKGSPFTSSGHYVVMAAVDDEYVYFLDPLRNNDYESYPRSWIMEVMAPGVTRVKIEDAKSINLSPHYVLIRYD